MHQGCLWRQAGFPVKSRIMWDVKFCRYYALGLEELCIWAQINTMAVRPAFLNAAVEVARIAAMALMPACHG